MVELAIWLICATVVACFALWGLAFLGVALSDGRWKYVLGVLGVAALILFIQVNQQQKQADTRRAQNGPLQQQCIDQAKSDALRLRQASMDSGTYTNTYASQLTAAYTRTVNNCRATHPTY